MVVSEIYDEPPTSAVNVIPGEAMADLDWDDDEEATNVFDRSGADDLFAEMRAKPKVYTAAEDGAKRHVAGAAALLASSGRSAAPVPKSMPPSSHMAHLTSGAPMAPLGPHPGMAVASMPAPEQLPRIPAPAPVPREIAESRPSQQDTRSKHPSWHPSAPTPTKRPSGSKSTLILALVAVMVLAAAGFFYLKNAAAAMVVVSVTHEGSAVEKVDIYVDGQKKCEFAPCKLELKPGKVALRVVSGALAGSRIVDVQGGKDLKIDIALGVSDETAPPASGSTEVAREGTATVKLSTKMTGIAVKVFVGDSKEGKPLPAELTDLPSGKVTLRFESDGDKYGRLEKTVELKPGETLDIADVELPLLKVKVTFLLITRGANVGLYVEEDGKRRIERLDFVGNKATVELDTSKTWTLEGVLKGHDMLRRKLQFEGGKEELEVRVELMQEREATTTPDPDASAKPDDKAAGHGFINANSIPPSKVIINGRPHGSTPVTGVKVPAGSYTVIFRHPELGTQSRTVTVGAGQTKTATVRFKKDE